MGYGLDKDGVQGTLDSCTADKYLVATPDFKNISTTYLRRRVLYPLFYFQILSKQ